MQVFYGTNFRGHSANASPLERITLNKEFTWGTISGFIPAIYVGEEGICIDFCIRVSNDEMQAFYNKWKYQIENDLSPREMRQIAKLNPLNFDFCVNVVVNGVCLKNTGNAGTCYSKLLDQDEKNNSVELELMQEYGCDEEDAWCFKRYMCQWQGIPDVIESLNITLIAENMEITGEPVEIGLDEEGKQYTIAHPVTQEQYMIEVCGVEQQELPEEVLEGMRVKRPQMEYPTHYLMMSYHMTPQLSRDRFHLSDKGEGGTAKTISHSQSASVAMIGVADGPTSVFVAGKMQKEKQKEEQIAMSAMYFEPVTKVCWEPVFLEKEREDMELHIGIK